MHYCRRRSKRYVETYKCIQMSAALTLRGAGSAILCAAIALIWRPQLKEAWAVIADVPSIRALMGAYCQIVA